MSYTYVSAITSTEGAVAYTWVSPLFTRSARRSRGASVFARLEENESASADDDDGDVSVNVVQLAAAVWRLEPVVVGLGLVGQRRRTEPAVAVDDALHGRHQDDDDDDDAAHQATDERLHGLVKGKRPSLSL